MPRQENAETLGHPHPRVAYWLGTAGAVFLVSVAAFSPVGPPGVGSGRASGAAAALVAATILALVVRGRFPRSAAAAVLGFSLVGTSMGGPVVAHFVALLVAVFGVARRSDRRTTLVVAGIAALLTATVSPLVLTGRWQTLEAAVQLVAFIGFAAAAGDATRSRREFIVAITERARRAEESKESEAKRRVAEERLRIARDLHDVMAHHIAVINLHASVASSALKDRPEEVEKSLATIREAARTVLGEIGGLLAMLRTSAPADRGAGGIGTAPGPSPIAPVPGLGQLDDLLADFRRSDFEIDLRTWGLPGQLPEPVDVVAYRIIQEALTNAHKHGSDGSALLNIDYAEDGVEIIVTNTTDASHPSASMLEDRSGHGMIGIRERVASVSGTVETSRGPGPVFRFTARLPFAAPERSDQQ